MSRRRKRRIVRAAVSWLEKKIWKTPLKRWHGIAICGGALAVAVWFAMAQTSVPSTLPDVPDEQEAVRVSGEFGAGENEKDWLYGTDSVPFEEVRAELIEGEGCPLFLIKDKESAALWEEEFLCAFGWDSTPATVTPKERIAISRYCASSAKDIQEGKWPGEEEGER